MSSVQAAPRADYAEIIRRLKDIEAETLWSHSYTRRLLIATLTYLIVCIYLYETESLDPFIEGISDCNMMHTSCALISLSYSRRSNPWLLVVNTRSRHRSTVSLAF
jgi:hypothetical protein